MNKQDLIDKMKAKTGFQSKVLRTALDAFLDCITEAMASHEAVKLVGFGTFKIKSRAERIGVNPLTKEKMTIKAKKVPAITWGEDMKNVVAKKKVTTRRVKPIKAESKKK